MVPGRPRASPSIHRRLMVPACRGASPIDTGYSGFRMTGALIWFPSSQGVVVRFVLRLRVAGPGCDLSEEAAVGIGPSALDCRVAPECPPGHVPSGRARLAS